MRGLFLPVLIFTFSAMADQTVKVKGMVCELCAQGIKKKLKGQKEIKDVEVKIKDQTVRIGYKDPKVTLPNEKLAKLLKEAGYELDIKK